MTEQLIDIGQRLRGLRLSQDLSPEAFAAHLGVSPEELGAYERGEKDFSFSFLYTAARHLGVDVVDLLSGDSPKLSTCCLVRRGGGFSIDRRQAYSYKHLAFTFRNKIAEPFMVTAEPKGEESPVQHAHEGQEFDYMVSGRMRFFLGDIVYDLEAGDSVYFDSGVPHAMQTLNGEPATFLAVVMKGENQDAVV
ncbi:MAG: XRE family transcriptional regulator [Oscillospiraceae bacterium]|jgi:transcriptional regulator with XRE-family HTH domain|nr:XRE family transcriptional regulator [Oscillospiraceae bacterium]